MLAKFSFVACVVLLCMSGAHAAVHAVSTPTELKHKLLNDEVAPGDEIVWQDGVYDAVRIDFAGADGLPGKPITLRAETPGGVVLTGGSSLSIGASYAVVSGFHIKTTHTEDALWKVVSFRSIGGVEASHSRLTECVIEEAEPGKPVLKSSKWVVLYGQYNRVDHCTFTGKRTHDNLMTVYLDESGQEKPAWHRIDHNYFGMREDGSLAGGTTNGWETIRIGDSKTSHVAALCRVEGNVFEQCGGEIEIISNKSCRNTYLNNTFIACEGQLTLRHGNDCLIAGNLFVGSQENAFEEGGVRVIGTGHSVIANRFIALDGRELRGAIVLSEGVRDGLPNEYTPVRDVLIRANLIQDCAEPLVVGTMSGRKAKNGKVVDVPPSAVLFAENIVAGKAPVATWVSKHVPDITFENNLVYGDQQAVVLPWEKSGAGDESGVEVQPFVGPILSQEDWEEWVSNARRVAGASW